MTVVDRVVQVVVPVVVPGRVDLVTGVLTGPAFYPV